MVKFKKKTVMHLKKQLPNETKSKIKPKDVKFFQEEK